MELSQLIQTVKAYRDAETDTILSTAFQIASAAHEGFQQQNGSPFIDHALGVASILASWYAPPSVVASGMLQHIFDSRYAHIFSMETLRRRLGSEVTRLLEATTNLNRIIRRFEEDFGNEYGSDIDEEFVGETGTNVLLQESSPFVQEWDAFVIVIADSLQNLQTIATLTPEQQKRIAHVMLHVFVPLADRLCMGYVKRELEDTAFKIINPEYYNLLLHHCTDASLTQAIWDVEEQIRQHLHSSNIKIEIRWQPFSLYTLSHHHMNYDFRYENFMSNEAFSLKVEDVGSFLVITEDEDDCYLLLARIHKLYPPVEKQIRDFIGSPGENSYRSFHTQVRHSSGQLLNMVIRTTTMDDIAEHGITMAWRNVPEELLPKLSAQTRSQDGKIQVYTPEGEIKTLPTGAIPVDFAYEISIDTGNHCGGVLVNGEPGDLFRPLQNGDTVEIITDNAESRPDPEWLKHVRTLHATHLIKRYLAKQNRTILVERGRTLLNTALQALEVSSTDDEVNRFLTQLAQKDNREGPEDILLHVGLGRYKASELVERLKIRRTSTLEEITLRVIVLSPEAVSLPREIAHCCHPIPPDAIVGHYRRDHTLVIHSASCSHIKMIKKTVPIQWDTTPPEPGYVIIIKAMDRPGLAAELSGVTSHLGYDMLRFDSRKLADGGMSETHIYLGKTTQLQRSQLRHELNAFADVQSVEIMAAHALVRPHLPNPYGPNPAEGHRFYGRDKECQSIRSLLCENDQNSAILLWGQKRIGKTSLLLRLVDQAEGDFLPVYIDLQTMAGCSTTQFLRTLIEQTFQQLTLHVPESIKDIPSPHFRRIKKEPLHHFDKFISSIQNAVQYQPIVVILDEFQYLCELREETVSSVDIFRHLRSLSQHGHGVHFIFSGGGLFSDLINQAGLASLLNITYDKKLTCLGKLAARNLITDGITRVSDIEDAAVDSLLEITSGHPYYLQMLCYKLYEQAQQDKVTITQSAVKEAIYEWLRQTDESRFQHLWEGNHGTNPWTNKVILSAIAQMQPDTGEVKYDQLYEAVQTLIQASNLVHSLEDLTYIGVLRQNQLSYTIEVELFALWLRQHWPLKLALEEAESL